MKFKRDKEQLSPYNQVVVGQEGKNNLFSCLGPSNQESGGGGGRVGSTNGVEKSVEFKALSATFRSCESGC